MAIEIHLMVPQGLQTLLFQKTIMLAKYKEVKPHWITELEDKLQENPPTIGTAAKGYGQMRNGYERAGVARSVGAPRNTGSLLWGARKPLTFQPKQAGLQKYVPSSVPFNQEE